MLKTFATIVMSWRTQSRTNSTKVIVTSIDSADHLVHPLVNIVQLERFTSIRTRGANFDYLHILRSKTKQQFLNRLDLHEML